MSKKEEKKMSCCSDVMKPIEASSCCTPQDTAADAAQAMKASKCGCTPVVESKEKLNLVGVVTERDVCHHVAADDRRASEVRVADIMRPAASACCGAEDSLKEAEQKLSEQQATSLPVVNKAGCCCGTISQHHLR